MKTTIRPIEPSDSERFAVLASQLGYPVEAAYAERRLREQAADPRVATFAFVSSDGQLVGWISCRIDEPAYRSAYGQITGLVIDDAHRSRGYGAELLAVAEDWFRSRGVAEVLVRSNILREAAHRFYDREGYALTKTQVVYRKELA